MTQVMTPEEAHGPTFVDKSGGRRVTDAVFVRSPLYEPIREDPAPGLEGSGPRIDYSDWIRPSWARLRAQGARVLRETLVDIP